MVSRLGCSELCLGAAGDLEKICPKKKSGNTQSLDNDDILSLCAAKKFQKYYGKQERDFSYSWHLAE